MVALRVVTASQPGDVATVADGFRAAIDAADAGATRQLTASYRRHIDRLTETARALTADIEARRVAGMVVSRGRLLELERARSLLTQAEAAFDDLAKVTGEVLPLAQRQAAQAAVTHAATITSTALGPPPPGGPTTLPFATLDEPAIRELTGNLSPGSPVRNLLDGLGADVSGALEDALGRGIVLGLHPDELMRSLKGVMEGGLARAATIVRTETHRVAREALRASYQANDHLIDGWIWHADLGPHTCAACWAMHGTRHPLDEPMGTHPNCRCTMVSDTKSWAELGFPGIADDPTIKESGEEAFAKLSPSAQRQILGPGRFDLYRQGKATLQNMVEVRRSPAWGTTRSVRPLKALQASAAGGGGRPPLKVIPGGGGVAPPPVPPVPPGGTGGTGGQPPAWRPSMPRKEADQWAANSAITRPLYHNTDARNVASLKAGGFDLSRSRFGRVWGNGVYMNEDPVARSMYRQWASGPMEELELRANVRTVHRVDLSGVRGNETSHSHVFRRLAGGQARYNQHVQDINTRNRTVLIDAEARYPFANALANPTVMSQRQAFIAASGYVERPEPAALVLTLQGDFGFDALEIVDTPFRPSVGGSQLVVFDPQRVVIVDEPGTNQAP